VRILYLNSIDYPKERTGGMIAWIDKSMVDKKRTIETCTQGRDF